MNSRAAQAADGKSAHHPDPATTGVQPRQLAINFLLLTAGEFVAKLLTFAAFSCLARVLHPDRYGSLEFTLAVMVFFTLPVDFGLGAYGAREIARGTRNAADLFREITGMRLVLACGSFVALLFFIGFLQKPAEVKALLTFYGFSLLSGPVLLQWFFQAHDKMHWVAVSSIVRQLTFSGLVFTLIRADSSLITIGLIECASVAAVGAFCIYVLRFRMHYALQLPSFQPSVLLPHVKQAFPIGLTELAWAFMWYFATVLLGFLFADESLGWFGASHRVLMALHTFVWLYFFNLLPSISRCVTHPIEDLLVLMKRSIRFASWTSLFVAFGLAILAKESLVIVYGPEFRGAARSFSVLVWMLPIAMLSGHYRYILIAYNRQNRLLLCTAASAASAVLLGLTLVPVYSEIGAAWALLLANVLNFVLVYWSVRQLVAKIHFHVQLFEAAGTTAVAATVFYSLSGLNVWIAAAISGAVYAVIMVLMHHQRMRAFYKLVRKRVPHSHAPVLKTAPAPPGRQ